MKSLFLALMVISFVGNNATEAYAATTVNNNQTTKVYWDGLSMSKGQIGKINVLKPINLWERRDGRIWLARILKPGERYRVYGYDNKFGGQYAVGGKFYVTKNPQYIEYKTPPKSKLAELNKVYKVAPPSPPVTKAPPVPKKPINNPDIPVAASNVGYATIGHHIYIVGGYSSEVSNELYVFDTTKKTWSKKKNMPTKRYDHSVAAVGNSLYVLGGYNGSARFNVNEVYDAKTNTWHTKVPMPEALEDMETAVIGKNIYVFGGSSIKGISNKVYIYDTEKNIWSNGSDMPVAAHAMGITVLNDRIHVLGGDKKLNAHLVYTPSNDTWEIKKSMPTGRSHLVAFAHKNRIYAMGGTVGRGFFDKPLNKVEIYNPTNDSWETANSLKVARSRFGLGKVNNEVYIVTGWTSNFFDKTLELMTLEK